MFWRLASELRFHLNENYSTVHAKIFTFLDQRKADVCEEPIRKSQLN